MATQKRNIEYNGETYELERITDAYNENPENTLEALLNLYAWDDWKDDEEGFRDYTRDLLERGLDGYFLYYEGRRIGYYALNRLKDLTEGDINTSKISEIIKYLILILGGDVSIDQIWHTYDYTVLEKYRGMGLGRLLARQTLEDILGEDEVKIGFVYYGEGDEHTSSLLALMYAGHFIGKDFPDVYGEGIDTLITVYSKRRPTFTGIKIDYRKGDDLKKLVKEIKRVTSEDEKALVGYNPDTESFEVAVYEN
ncbi:MAG: GNAT family N-acetyltransferase [Candidatus Aenigmatarchaeota archaeon]